SGDLHRTEELKKSPTVLNVRQGVATYMCGSGYPPIGCIRRERPSTPSAPYSLTRPVVPPDGSFIFGAGFSQGRFRFATPWGCCGSKTPVIRGGANNSVPVRISLIDAGTHWTT